ncbi:MAG: hypothetical protein OXF30_00605 [Candidatus Saccharibacteria bacterium]|nr:hypothetical protein [Candidatus Saccharibacteria bacterium]
MNSLFKRNPEKDKAQGGMVSPEELKKTLKDKEITPTKDFLVSLGKALVVVGIILALFLVGRWIWQDDSDDQQPVSSSETVVDEVETATETTVAVVETSDTAEKSEATPPTPEELTETGLLDDVTWVTALGLVLLIVGVSGWHALLGQLSKQSFRK